MQVTRDGEKPGTKAGVGAKVARMPHESQPGLLEQFLRDIPAPRQACEEIEEPSVERGVHDVERRSVSCSKSAHQFAFDVRVHAFLVITRTGIGRDACHGCGRHAFMVGVRREGHAKEGTWRASNRPASFSCSECS